MTNIKKLNWINYGEAIAQGYYQNLTPWRLAGYTPTLNATASEVWEKAGAYVFPTAAGQWEAVSSSAGDEDLGAVIKGDATGDTVQADAGGTLTTLVDADVDFTAATAVAAGDCLIVDPHGASPEFAIVTQVAAHTLTFAGGLSAGGSGASRYYAVVDKGGGTGAQVIRLRYLTSAYAEKSELVCLNGNTAVDTVNTDLYRLNGLEVVAVGSGGAAVGSLTVQADGAGAVYGYVAAGGVLARSAVYTVPAGMRLWLAQVVVGFGVAGANVAVGRLAVQVNRTPVEAFAAGVFYPVLETLVVNGTAVLAVPQPVSCDAGADVLVSGTANTAGAASVLLFGYLEEV